MRLPGHSWSPIFGRDTSENKKFILISTLTLDRAVLNTDPKSGDLGNTESLGTWSNVKTELNDIQIVPGSVHQGKCLVRLGCAVTNEQLRRWCIDNKLYTLPLNVIMVEITIGGSNAPIW